MSQIPQAILDQLEAQARAIALLQGQVKDQAAIVAVRQDEEARLQKMREKSRFQGVGDPIPNPNQHAFLKYPSARYHPEFGVRMVDNAREDAALGEGWYDSPAKFAHVLATHTAPEPHDPVDGRTKAGRALKESTHG